MSMSPVVFRVPAIGRVCALNACSHQLVVCTVQHTCTFLWSRLLAGPILARLVMICQPIWAFVFYMSEPFL
ncbi:unnamed protein product [Brassica oleracea var. botrytis]